MLLNADNKPNYVLEYWEKIQAGKIIVCKKIKQVYRQLVADMQTSDRYDFDIGRANRPIEFAETFCKNSKGKYAGQLIQLELWEKAFIAAAFGFVSKTTGRRRFRKVVLIVARKNGKSTLAACVALYMLTKDNEIGAECYSLATKRDQAKLIWQEAKNMVKQSPELQKRLRLTVSEIAYDKHFAFFKPLSSDSNTLDGLNPSFVVEDELHTITDKNLVDVMEDGMVSRENAMFLITTTAGSIRESVYDDEYDYCEKVIDHQIDDDSILPIIYELDKRKEWTERKNWIKANPALGTIKDLDELSKKVEKAKNKPNELPNLLCKHFNIRETSEFAWLTFEQLNNPAVFDVQKKGFTYAIAGVDLSSTTDLTSVVVILRKRDDPTVYVLPMFWLPEELLEKRVREDKIPYDAWHKQGLLRLCEGNRINNDDIRQFFSELRSKFGIYLLFCGFDPWGSVNWVKDMKSEFGDKSMIEVRQGAKTMSEPMKVLAADLEKKTINYNDNNILKWCLSNVKLQVDTNDNIRPVKQRQTRRIDGAVALIIAYVVYLEKMQDYLNMV